MTEDDDTGFQGERFEGWENVWSVALGEAAGITNHLRIVPQKGVLKTMWL